jgi:flagellar biosynthesis/type III secretory pathway protein FliH
MSKFISNDEFGKVLRENMSILADNPGMRIIEEIGIEKGIEKGREEGMEKGREEGVINAIRKGKSLDYLKELAEDNNVSEQRLMELMIETQSAS